MGARTAFGITVQGPRSAAWVAERSQNALDRPLSCVAELDVTELSSHAVILGAFQRGASFDANCTLFRRGSGGPAVLVSEGTVHVLIALETPSALCPCSPDKLVNRYVRPLLRALTRMGAQAHFFGRDWISVKHRPAAWVGFAHDAESGRAAVEAFVAVSAPFADSARASFLGKEPGTLSAITGRDLSSTSVAAAIAEAYAAAYALEVTHAPPAQSSEDTMDAEDVRADPPWACTEAEVIGEIAAGYDRSGILRVGGDLLVSRNAIVRLEEELAALPKNAPDSEIARLVDRAFTADGVALDGVRDLANIASVIVRARGEGPA